MTKAPHIPHASPFVLSIPPAAIVGIPGNPLLTTFLMKKDRPEIQLRRRGCREVVPLEHPRPSRIKGVIELDEQIVPVIDANARLGFEQTKT